MSGILANTARLTKIKTLNILTGDHIYEIPSVSKVAERKKIQNCKDLQKKESLWIQSGFIWIQ